MRHVIHQRKEYRSPAERALSLQLSSDPGCVVHRESERATVCHCVWKQTWLPCDAEPMVGLRTHTHFSNEASQEAVIGTGVPKPPCDFIIYIAS